MIWGVPLEWILKSHRLPVSHHFLATMLSHYDVLSHMSPKATDIGQPET
jgi:hypothetical protein